MLARLIDESQYTIPYAWIKMASNHIAASIPRSLAQSIVDTTTTTTTNNSGKCGNALSGRLCSLSFNLH